MARRDWRRQLFRIRQIADQNLGRVEKSELLTADLQNLEKRVEQYGKVFAGTSKKLIPCLQTQPGQDREKRQKKLPAHALSCQLLDSATQLGVDTLIGQIFQMCGDAQAHVAKKTLDFEFEIEDQVLAPIYRLIENDIPAILKHKKNLQKVVLDMDSAKTRYSAAMKEQNKASGSNPQASTTKVDNLREEFDDACYRVDQCRDQLATEIFNLASREAELSNILLELIKCQAKYHKDVLDSLEKRIPQMEEQMQFYQHVPVFGKPIEDHLERSKRTIALVLEECVKNLITLGGLEEEGLFRIAGAANKIKKLKAAFDSEQIAEIAEEYDVHVIAGVLKLYLRELPDPLMKSSLYPDWMKAAHMPADERLQALAEVLAKLPKVNSENLKFLIKFLHKISEFQEVNKMSPSNLSIVMGPNLIWAQGENGPSVLTTSAQSAIVEALISHCDYFFPGDDDIFKQIFTNLESASLEPSQPDLLTSVTSGERSGHTPPPGQPEYRQPSPDVMSQTSTAQALVSSIHSSAAVGIGGSQENVSSSSSSGCLSVSESQSGSKVPSPKPPRRMNKKPAPLPPAERPHGPAPPPPCGLSSTTAATTVTSVVTGSAAATNLSAAAAAINSLPYPLKPPMPQRSPEQQQTTARIEGSPEQQQVPLRPEKPPEQLQQQHQQVVKQEEKPGDQQANTQLDKPPEHQATVPRPERPPDFQVMAKPERPPEYQVGSKPDRPSSPTKVRPSGPPPERPQPSEKPEKPARPEKPEKPSGTSVEKLYPSLSPVVTSPPPAYPKKPSLTSSEEHSPPQVMKMILNAPSDVTEKPPVPPPPGVKPDGSGHTHRPSPDVVTGHRRQSSGCNRPPRPQPPPPPPPNKPTYASQVVDSSDKATSSGTNTDNQTPASPNPGEDTYL